jgi:hypothetical protein
LVNQSSGTRCNAGTQQQHCGPGRPFDGTRTEPETGPHQLI